MPSSPLALQCASVYIKIKARHLQKTQKKTFKNHETFSKNHISRQKSQNHPPLLDLTRHVIIRHYDVKLSLYRKALFLPGYLKISRAQSLLELRLHYVYAIRDVPNRGREHPQPGEARGAGDQLSLDRARGCFQCMDAGILSGKLLNSFCACLQAEDSCSIPLSSSQPLEDCLSSKESNIHANCRPTAKKNETTSNLFEKNGRISDQNDQNFWILACQ